MQDIKPDENTIVSKLDSDLPISCCFQNDSKLFCINTCKGKTLASGGFGVVLSRNSSCSRRQLDDADVNDQRLKKKLKETNLTDDVSVDGGCIQIAPSQHFLFIEEVLFLHERGLLESFSRNSFSIASQHPPKATRLESEWRKQEAWELYELLPACGVSLAAYLVYAYLRNQTFRVVRHTASRRLILNKMKEARCERANGIVNEDNNLTKLRRLLRRNEASALSPTIHGENLGCQRSTGVSIIYDVYRPNSQFSRNSAGPPDFNVSATYHNSDLALNFCDLQSLLAQSNGISLCVAAVSDSGIVVMYGVTDFKVSYCGNAKHQE